MRRIVADDRRSGSADLKQKALERGPLASGNTL
jgi:hypothetical protein